MDTMQNMMRLMCLPWADLQAVCKTSDGMYMGRSHGDIGYNRFFGKPNHRPNRETRDHVRRIWIEMTEAERIAVIELADNPPDGMPMNLLEDFGVPVDKIEYASTPAFLTSGMSGAVGMVIAPKRVPRGIVNEGVDPNCIGVDAKDWKHDRPR
jgi:hypothetical protein